MNPAAKVLLALGLVLTAGGGIIAIAAKRQLDQALLTANLGATIGLSNDFGAAAAEGWMWFGIVTAVLGAVMLLAVLIIAAARRPAVPAVAE